MLVNITEEFIRQLMAQIDFLTAQNKQCINSYCRQHESDHSGTEGAVK